ncbi:reverse transcriptase domain-containing protein [Tanacetum coccineum]
MGEFPPITASTFTARSLENTQLANRASTSAILDPMISPAFVEANYEVLESFRTKLYYYNEVYDEERERERNGAETGGNSSFGGVPVHHPYGGYASQVPMSNYGPAHNGPMPFVDSSGCVTPFARWIEDYPLLDGLKLPSYVGSYDGKGDPNNYLHLLEGAIHDTLQIPELHEEQRISGFVHGLNIRSLVEFLSTNLPITYKGKKKNRDRFSPYKESNHGLVTNLSKSPREILATEKVAKACEQPPRMVGSRQSCDMIKYYHFHEDHGHETNQCRELRHQIKEAIKQVNWACMDIGSSCEVIYEHCFLKLKPSIRALRLDSKIPLIGFLREHSWPLRDVPLENMGIVASTIHRAIEFHTPHAPKRNEAVCEEVDELTKAGILWEVKYQTWVANPVMIETAEGDEDKTTFFTGKGKCSFGVEEGPFLGHLITKQGIKANLSKVNAITDLTLLRTLKEIQGLNGKLAALSRFLSKGLDKSLPLFKVLKRCMEKKTIQWTTDAEETFQKMKSAGLMLVNLEGIEYTYPLRFEFETTNNEAEYESLLAGLRIAADMKIKDSSIFMDSQLVSNQVKGLFKARQSVIKQYPDKAKEFLESFNSYSMEHVRRDQNKKYDSLRKLALMTFS